MKMTVIELWCNFKGYQGSTIHQVKEEFSKLSIDEMDRFCSVLSDRILSISDPRNARDLMNIRLNKCGL